MGKTLCILGCGNLGTAILKGLISHINDEDTAEFDTFIACVRSTRSEQRLAEQFEEQYNKKILQIAPNGNVDAVSHSDTVILAVDPSEIEATLTEDGIDEALEDKLLISVAAGWTREALENLIPTAKPGSERRTWVLRTLPNIAALVSQSLTAIEEPAPSFPALHLRIADTIFSKIGTTINVPPSLMATTTAVGGSTPAFFAIICDALIDASVAVGVPRASAQQMIYQSMMGTATMLKSGVHPAALRDQGTSPEGCTIAGVMVLEEGAVRGTVGRALREAVTVARLMGREEHLNDTRHSAGSSR